MPPGIIADINSVSAGQRESLRRPHGRAVVGGRAFDPAMCTCPELAPAPAHASLSANSSISTPHRSAFLCAVFFCGLLRIVFLYGLAAAPCRHVRAFSEKVKSGQPRGNSAE
jgi:hypothetical protein